mmetsp:Transcript_42386/g.113391  ORF Transcript_42386/g.113391 Transcript_42386/m.113391 type:complete len:159 (-) Transcript_42386:296-772(-)
MDGTIKVLDLNTDGVGSVGFTIADWSIHELQYRPIKNRDVILKALEWATPFGGLPILSVAPGSLADASGAKQFDVMISLCCNITNMDFRQLPVVREAPWRLTTATMVEFDLSRVTARDFAKLFRALLGNRLHIAVARTSHPLPALQAVTLQANNLDSK